MLGKITRSLALALALGSVSAVALAFDGHPVLISKPDFNNGYVAPELAENGAYFLTSDGYPMLRDSQGNWIYVVNSTQVVLMPFEDGYVWSLAAGPVIMPGRIVSVPPPPSRPGQVEPRFEPSWYDYSIPQRP